MKRLLVLIAVSMLGCSSSSDAPTTPTTPTETDYFPPLSGNTWETRSLDALQWNNQAKQPLLDYLESKHTKSFMVLVNGRIVIEHYFGDHTASSPWYWASAGKTLTATVTGIAQQQGFLSVDDPVNAYLGNGWTSATTEQENQIKIKHLLSMTSGLQDAGNDDCVSPDCLTFAAAAGTRWAYDNVYVKLQDVVAEATGQTWDSYFSTQLKNKIGMTGAWIQTGDLSIYWSTARSMARFGLLALHNGQWEGQQIVNASFFETATHPTQDINESYGYLWWINGESSFRLPQSQLEFPGSIIPSGPGDMYMALGMNDQKIYVVPSRKMIVIRMGDAADDQNPAISDFDEVLWQKINALYQ
ncbi:serine hydrolase domain-containing protein [Flavobacterium caeni]|uniref:CubicO group peptidase, beta-lactamase class C family n=1 Tax=Flavobacterium caeni TaxID=490189 RepID=A0A1G5AMT0_9FLAO|nr:serine hydrolase [Flavobacterium caeni]SCX79208.1 CubicO group peptidase, beta-lactamase class C family [Flavobacterium caeni]